VVDLAAGLLGGARRFADGALSRINRGCRQLPGVDEPAQARQPQAATQDRVPPRAVERRRRRHEAHRRARDSEILARRRSPLALVGVEQRVGRGAGANERKLPGEVGRVLDARVHATRTEHGHQVRRVAGEKDPPDAEPACEPLVEAVGSQPDELVRGVADEGPDSAVEGARRSLRLGVRLGRDLPVDPPLAVRLRVDEDLAAGVRRRVKVEPALVTRELRKLGAYVDDQEAVVEALAREGDADEFADGGTGAVGGDRKRGRNLAAV
jgi:hypothetical protein